MDHQPPTALDARDHLVERAMKVISTLTPSERDEFIRTVYRYVYGYRSNRNPNLLIELVNGAIATVALRESPEHARAQEELRIAKEATKGQPPLDIHQLLAEERERRGRLRKRHQLSPGFAATTNSATRHDNGDQVHPPQPAASPPGTCSTP